MAILSRGRKVFLSLAALLGLSSAAAQVDIAHALPNNAPALTADDVKQVVAQGVAFLKSASAKGIIAVCDHEGHLLAVYRMTNSGGADIRIASQATVKARTAAFFESDSNAFSTRTAQFIVQRNFPPGVNSVDAGPLFGVPLSNFPGADVQLQTPPFIVFINGINAPSSPPGLSTDFRPPLQPLVITPLTDDPGGFPLFKRGASGKLQAAGAVGVEVDGFGVVQEGVPDAGVTRAGGTSRMLLEEKAALAAQNGFRPPPSKIATKILINGFRLPYSAVRPGKSSASGVDLAAEGTFETFSDTNGSERDPAGAGLPASAYKPVDTAAVAITLPTQPRPTPIQEFPRRGFVARFPPRDTPLGDGSITAADVTRMVQQAANEAFITRAAIRRPVGSPAAVWISVVDRAGNICGVFRTEDATVFSFDLAVQKARTSAFFSSDAAGFSSRAIGFIAQTTYPPGISSRPPGPLGGLLSSEAGVDPSNLGGALGTTKGSGLLTEISQLLVDKSGTLATTGNAKNDAINAIQVLSRRLPHVRDGRLSPLQVGITVDLTLRAVTGGPATTIPNGVTFFPGGVPIYKGGRLVGGLGVSGDGVDQDDVIVFAGSKGFEPPENVRCDAASGAALISALTAAVAKLKTQFPNLTNGADGVLDVVAARIAKGPDVFEGLRLPYVKFPREFKR